METVVPIKGPSFTSRQRKEQRDIGKDALSSAAGGFLCVSPAPYTIAFILLLSTFAERRKQWHPTPVLLPGKSHGWRSLVGCSPWGHKESDTTEQLHFHSSLSCIEEENGNPLQCSCLENPRDSRAWWAAVYGVAQSRTRLKRLSSSIGTLVFCI